MGPQSVELKAITHSKTPIMDRQPPSAHRSPAQRSISPVLQLQRTIGNRAVARLIQAGLQRSVQSAFIQRDSATPPSVADCGSDGRALTAEERSSAGFVFGSSLNLDPICIKESSVMAAGGYVRTLPDTIYVAPGTKDKIGRPLLIHELTHCAQYQHGVSRATTAAAAINAHYDYGGEQGLRDAIAKKKCFGEFNTEQQADIVQDYYVKAGSSESTYPWSVFVGQVRAQGACVWPSDPAPAPEPNQPAPGTGAA